METLPFKKERLISEHIPFVEYIANKCMKNFPQNIERDDIISYGCIGLIDAANKFDCSRDVKFKTYAEIRIRGAIFDGLRSTDWVPRSIRRSNKELEEAQKNLELILGRQYEQEELAEYMGIKIEELQDIIRLSAVGKFTSIFDLIKDEAEGLYFLADSKTEDYEKDLNFNEDKLRLDEIINSLSDKEQKIIHYYYYDELTFKQIGERMNLSETRIYQIHTNILVLLRKRMQTNRR